MSVSLPNGALIAIASAYSTYKNITTFTNGNPGVATLEAGHGIVVGDIFETQSGWSKVTDRIFRAATVVTNDVGVEALDTTLTNLYPAGGGTGRIREITGWTQVSQILNSTSSGGAQQFQTYQFLEGDAQLRIPTFKDARGLAFTIGDDPTLPGYIQLAKANDDRLPRAIRIALPSGSMILYNAYVSLDKTPSLTVNNLMEVTATLSLLSEPVRY